MALETPMPELVEAELVELRDLLAAKRIADPTVTAHLRDTIQVYAIEVDRDHLTEEAWELVDGVEHHIATELDGLIHALDDGLFDRDLRRIVALGDG